MKTKKREQRLSPGLQVAAEQLAGRARGPLGRLEQTATEVEELLARSEAGFLGGNLLAIMGGAVLREMRADTARAIAALSAGRARGEPSDLVDEADVYASAVGELAMLFKLLAGLELDEKPELRVEWERLSDRLLETAGELQQAVEAFESALEDAEPEEPAPEGAAPSPGLRAASRVLLHRIWEQAQAGAKLTGEQERLARIMLEHPEYRAAFEKAGELGDAEFTVDGVNPFAHVAMHAAVETQLASGEPPEVRAALERLMAAGATRHEALHQIGAAFAGELFEMQREGRPFDRIRYIRRLNALQ